MATNLARLFIAALGALVLVTMAGRAQFATLPEGPSRDLVEQVCGGCHDIEMVAINGRSGERWRLTIDEMSGYGLRLSAVERAAILQYLTTYLPPR